MDYSNINTYPLHIWSFARKLNPIPKAHRKG